MIDMDLNAAPMVATDTSPADWARNRFAGKTDELERPVATMPEYRYTAPHELRALQSDWDAAEAMRVKREAWFADNRAKRAAAAEAEADRKAAEAKAKSDAARAATLGELKARFLRTPGTTEADWDALDHDAVLRDYALQRATNGEAAREEAMAKRAMASGYTG